LPQPLTATIPVALCRSAPALQPQRMLSSTRGVIQGLDCHVEVHAVCDQDNARRKDARVLAADAVHQRNNLRARFSRCNHVLPTADCRTSVGAADSAAGWQARWCLQCVHWHSRKRYWTLALRTGRFAALLRVRARDRAFADSPFLRRWHEACRGDRQTRCAYPARWLVGSAGLPASERARTCAARGRVKASFISLWIDTTSCCVSALPGSPHYKTLPFDSEDWRNWKLWACLRWNYCDFLQFLGITDTIL
jgi:hypothetical protein